MNFSRRTHLFLLFPSAELTYFPVRFSGSIIGITIIEGPWEEFSQSSERLAQIEANQVSYAWDDLIEAFAGHIMAGTSYYNSSPKFNDQITPLKFLAREPRTRRRFLARTLLEFIKTIPASCRATRVIKPSNPGDPFYVFLLLPHLPKVIYNEYREVRQLLLEQYCKIVKLDFPNAEDIVGIATESGRKENSEGSEDVVYLDARFWTSEIQAQTEAERENLKANNLLGDRKEFSSIEKEYPDVDVPKSSMSLYGTNSLMKGRDRNQPCPCGSGKKVKKCCGR